ncbi:MAG: cyclic nucleotide-binding domain-containing protein, partial [Desulfobacterales bacterium]|nr:cyclic nucleotide-binding domain-containing protein [Desulfobacterales bacterium]
MTCFYTKRFYKNQIIFKQGQKGDVAYILKEGTIEISQDINGRKVVLAKLTPLNVFGEMALILNDHKRTATAIALDYCDVVEIHKTDFDHFMNQSPKIIKGLLSAITERLVHTTIKAVKIPDIFIGTIETLELLAAHHVYEIDMDQFINSVSTSLVTDPKEIKNIIHQFETHNLLEVKQDMLKTKIIYILVKRGFAKKA